MARVAEDIANQATLVAVDVDSPTVKEEGGGLVYECQLCNVHSVSYQNIQAHLRGRSHMDMVQRSEVAQRSVYLRGFTSTPTTEEDLCEVMGQFGGVVSVVVKASDDDTYALVEFSSRTAALQALRHPSPLTVEGHTLTVKPRLVKPRKPPKRHVKSGRKPCVDVAMVTDEASNEGCKEEDGSEGSAADMVGGIRLTSEAVSAVSSAYSMDTQLEAIAHHCRYSTTAAEVQLVLAWQLQCKLRIHVPSCMVVPFGAPFSGHGTVSSDCDLSVILDPSPLEAAMFSGSAYLPLHLLPKWEQLQTTPTGPPTGTASPSLALSQGHTSKMEPFDWLLSVVKEDQQCSQVWALRQARCPIISFIYRPHQLHCDLSVNNRLGPANTRLLTAYMNFDPRMAVLVPCVRLWARGWGIKRSMLNNYSLSLMLIHSLQHISPPVLPCLQDPGVWPKNMVWISSQGFSVASEQHVQLDGWDCSFSDPHSLLPSSNTVSPAHLLLHFFNYYAEFPFSEKAVAIHTFSPPLICNLPLHSAGQSTGFRVSALCVQDPFEQNHNVSKNVKSPLLPSLRQAFQSSEKTLGDMITSELIARPDVLSLFKQQALPFSGKKGAAVHSLNLDSTTASRLLLDTRYAALADRLSELNVKSAHIRSTLSHVLLQSLALKLEREFGFQVHAEEAQEDVSCASSLSCVPPTDMVVPVGIQRKRQRPSEEFEEGMEVDEEEEGKVQRIKRLKLLEQESAEQLLFHLTDGEEGSGYTLVCSAMEESWIHRRRKRRKKERVASASSETAGPMTTTPTTPCLSFTLTSVPSFHLATVVLCISNPAYQQSFQLFFAILKKWLLCSSPSQS